jgi:hypothetical protein
LARVFVSYARTDRRAVERVAQELVAAGHEAWIDVDDIPAGESWRSSIVRSIARSDAVVVFLSPASAASRQIATEVNLATESGKRIFPVMFGDAQMSEELRYNLAGLQFIDLTTDRREGTSALIAALESLERNHGAAPPGPPESRASRAHSIGRWRWVAAAAALLGTVILVGLVLRAARDSNAAATTATTVTPATNGSTTTATTATPTTNDSTTTATTATPNDSTASDSSTDVVEPLFLEAEDGRIVEPIAVRADLEASARAYVSSTEGGGPSDDLGGTVSLEFDIDGTGSYLVWGRVASDTDGPTSSDSFFVSLDDGPEDVWDFFQPIGGTDKWEWDLISLRCEEDGDPGSFSVHFCDPWSIHLTSGRHVLTFRTRDPLSRLDAIVIVDEDSPDLPTTLGQ